MKGKFFWQFKINIVQPGRNIPYNTRTEKQFISYIYMYKSIHNTDDELVSKQLNLIENCFHSNKC